jgi:Meiotically up-regulated gene 113
MKLCVSCKALRAEGSFYADGSQPDDKCKPCIHRPRRPHVGVLRKRHTATRADRSQAAIRFIIKHEQAEKQPFVYLMKAGQFYKIGFSTSIYKRIRQLETASSESVQLIAVAPGGRQLERKLHHEFRNSHVRLEWFKDHRNAFVECFRNLPGSMVFLPGYMTAEPSAV